MSEKILLIDGHSIINRAFYGVSGLTTSDGFHTNAIYGFLNTMFKTLEEEKPDYITVAFDLKAPTFRHEMYEKYKGTRKPMPDELFEQVPVLKELLHAMGISTMEKEGLEADDLLGTIAKRSEEKGLEVAILSGDRDLLQLASDHVRVRIPRTKAGVTEIDDYNVQEVIHKYQVTPLQFIDLKALMGDTSDNIPGVPGIGEKTATNLIVRYGSIEDVYAHLEEITPNRVRELLRNNRELAELSKVLSTIHTDCDYQYEWEDARVGDIFTPEAFIYFKKLEFKNMLSRFNVDAPVNKLEAGFKEVTELAEVEKVFSKMSGRDQIAFDVIFDEEQVFGISLALSESEIYYIPIGGFVSKNYLLQKLTTELEQVKCAATLELKSQLKFLESDTPFGPASIQNREIFFDTGIAAYLLNPLKGTYSYDDLAKEFLELMVPSREDLFGKLKLEIAADEKPEEFVIYSCYKSYVSYMSRSVLKNHLSETGMMKLFEDIEMPLVFTLFDMEQEGIRVKAEELKIYGDQLAVRISELEKDIYRQAGEEFNINSPKQLGVILFENLGMPGGKKTKTGYSTSADVLERLAGEYPIVSDILEYRQLTKLKSTYADGLANYIGQDGRIHSTFQQTVAATGRLSSTDPNLQNIPVRVELGRLIRKVFIPREDFVFIDADYSQIELRILAHMSGDKTLIQAYKDAQDIHRITASQVFHTPFDEVTDLQRRNAKAVNFGIVYGISSFGLSQDLSITRKEAQEYIKNYFETYPRIKDFLDGLVADAKEYGYVTTLFGRRRPVPELKSSNFVQRGFGERVAMNSPIQGTAADIIKIAMIRVDSRLRKAGMKSRLVLQVHDELLVEAHKSELDEVEAILAEEMRGAADMSVPLEVDIHRGNNWYEAH